MPSTRDILDGLSAIANEATLLAVAWLAGAAGLTALAIRGDRRPVSDGPEWTRRIGAVTLAFAWVYPHFLDAHPGAYLYASPVGLVPCPTLAVVTGFRCSETVLDREPGA